MKSLTNTFPLAVLTPSIGTCSETFIARHITDLMPGQTITIVRKIISYSNPYDFKFPYIQVNRSKKTLRWFYNSCAYFLGMKTLSPIQEEIGRMLKRHRVQTVLSEYLDASLQSLKVARSLGIPFFAHAHGYDVSQCMRDPAMRLRYRDLGGADGIITMSEYSKRKLIEIGLNESIIHVIPYGVDVPDTPVQRKSGEEIRCITVGRMVAKKAPLLMLKVFQLACSENPRLRLDYVGDGEMFDNVRRFIEDQGLKEKVTLHGSKANSVVQTFMNRADIFIQHSLKDPVTGDEEGLPVAILEAMANSLPVVATRHAGIPEAILHGISGYLVEEGDVHNMASCILRLAGNVELRNDFGQAGWKRAKEIFSWEREKNALLNVMGLHKRVNGS
jgi:colanic acid/amylovoran biosynthesis glycosyltransferase